jgi:hypothetical protein
MSDLKYLVIAAAAEVRGTATDDQLQLLHADPEDWRDALHELLADLDRQVERNARDVDRLAAEYPANADAERERHKVWLSKHATFRTYVERRLAAFEHDTAVRRRRRLDEAHRRLAATVAEHLVGPFDDVAHLAGDVVIDADDLAAVHAAYQDLLDAAGDHHGDVLVGADL